MSPGFEQDPQERRRQAEAELLLLRVALVLIGDARRTGAFETDEEKLAARAAELAAELAGGEPEGGSAAEPLVRAMPLTADQVSLSAPFGPASTEQTLRADGVLLGGGTTVSFGAQTVDKAGLSPEETEEMMRAVAEFEAKQARPQFGGARFLRAVVPAPQPGAEVQVLAAALFDDGLLVHYTHDQEPEDLESIMADPSTWLESGPVLGVEDDLGTEYYASGAGGGGGVQVVHGASGFAPAVPAGAGTLRITTRAGTVELPL